MTTSLCYSPGGGAGSTEQPRVVPYVAYSRMSWWAMMWVRNLARTNDEQNDQIEGRRRSKEEEGA